MTLWLTAVLNLGPRLKAPQGTDIVRIRAGLPSQDNAGAKAWFDDIALVTVAD